MDCGKMWFCKACRAVPYCSKAYQLADWKDGHRNACWDAIRAREMACCIENGKASNFPRFFASLLDPFLSSHRFLLKLVAYVALGSAGMATSHTVTLTFLWSTDRTDRAALSFGGASVTEHKTAVNQSDDGGIAGTKKERLGRINAAVAVQNDGTFQARVAFEVVHVDGRAGEAGRRSLARRVCFDFLDFYVGLDSRRWSESSAPLSDMLDIIGSITEICGLQDIVRVV